MIKDLHLQNFQSHESTDLEFAPGLNVIVGASDSGKSAIIRALRWLVWNRPMGDGFRSWWGGDTSVSVTLSEEITITRSKGKDNTYTAHDDHMGGETKTYKAFGNDVPEDVQAALNMDETNLQQQLDRPFLISNSPGEVATFFNRIARLDKIDTGTKAVNGEVRRITSQIAADEERSKELEQELQGYDYLEKFEVDLEEFEKLSRERDNMATALEDLRYGVVMIDSYTENLERIEELTQFENDVNDIVEQQQVRDDLAVRKGNIKDQKDAIQRIESTLSTQRRELTDMEEYYHEHMPDECPLCGSEIQTKN